MSLIASTIRRFEAHLAGVLQLPQGLPLGKISVHWKLAWTASHLSQVTWCPNPLGPSSHTQFLFLTFYSTQSEPNTQTQITASELRMRGTEVGLLIWVPTKMPTYNMDTPSYDIKGQNIWYHTPEKIPKPGVTFGSQGPNYYWVVTKWRYIPYLLLQNIFLIAPLASHCWCSFPLHQGNWCLPVMFLVMFPCQFSCHVLPLMLKFTIIPTIESDVGRLVLIFPKVVHSRLHFR